MSPIIEHVEKHLERFDHKRYSVLKKVMEAPGLTLPIIQFSDDEDYEPAYFQHYGFLFLMEGAVVMPFEIRERLLQVDAKRLKALLDRNTEWVQLTQGLLYYYGIMQVPKLKENVEFYTGQSIDHSEFWHVIYELYQYDFSIQYSEFGVSHFMVDEPQRLEIKQCSRANLDYYPFTKAQVLRAADDGYVDRPEGYRQFVLFLHKHWDMAEEEADVITAELVDRIQRGDSHSELISSLQEDLEFSDMNQLQQLLNVIMTFMNNTRLWEPKGYTPKELSKKEQNHLKPLPQHPLRNVVYSFETKQKVGRNDPCPCGSGKKFKKCCGS